MPMEARGLVEVVAELGFRCEALRESGPPDRPSMLGVPGGDQTDLQMVLIPGIGRGRSEIRAAGVCSPRKEAPTPRMWTMLCFCRLGFWPLGRFPTSYRDPAGRVGAPWAKSEPEQRSIVKVQAPGAFSGPNSGFSSFGPTTDHRCKPHPTDSCHTDTHNSNAAPALHGAGSPN